jgi:type II secretory pathway component PulF
MTFAYTAYDAIGQSSSGQIDANNAAEASDLLRRKGLFVTDVREATAAGGRTRKSSLGYGKRLRCLAMFGRQLQVLVAAGTPLVQAIQSVEKQAEDPAWRSVVTSLREGVESGVPLSESMRKHPAVFDAVALSLISAGETSGDMPAMLERLSQITRKQLKLRSMLIGAMVYPALLISLGTVVTLTLLLFVLPRFSDLFAELGSELPPSTKVLMWISGMLWNYWWAIVPAAVLGGFGLVYWISRGHGTDAINALLLKIPRVGILVRSLMTARLARMLGTLLESRVSLFDALRLAREGSTHSSYVALLASAEEAVGRGEPVSAVLATSDLISPPVQEAIRTGEQSGRLGGPLVQMAEFLDEENDTAMKALTSLIEPTILIILGVIVGAIAMSMFLPLFDLVSAAQRGGRS